jgi:cyanophycin synthetase
MLPELVGDGLRTVDELVEIANRDPRRSNDHENILTPLQLDNEARRQLAAQGHTPKSVPGRGETVVLRANANLSTGATSIDVTEGVHPDNRDMAVRAVTAIGLDLGGVDFITGDISSSYRASGGAICEVNASPGLRMHLAPAAGKPRDVAGPIIDMLFPPAERLSK